ncbi:hypothetical protein [Alicyclobacillus dauci]|uniref:ABC-2 family transporter protein n=1 Tax=Alicyclobacillus dauci TaxID=1475485 RepID=A0ABY6Z4I3_9BACL|nr:hypothetical protein [Alicyclobacillus dauci]WAH37742.1 hypothetical protein NZD86_04360 [Alicyclobacillus dauci]
MWMATLRKDLLMTRVFALVSMGCTAVAGMLLVGQAYRSHTLGSSESGLIIMATLLGLEIFYLPTQLVVGIVREWRGTASLWLQSAQSGWALIASKVVSACVWALSLNIVTYVFTLWFYHLALAHAPLWKSSSWAHWLLEHQFLVGMYILIGLLWIGLGIGLWLMLISIVMRSVRYKFKGLPWLAAFVVILIPAWGLQWLQDTALYHRIFDFGAFVPPGLDHQAFASAAQMAPQPWGVLYGGHLLTDVVVLALVFYVSGWLFDKRVEV